MSFIPSSTAIKDSTLRSIQTVIEQAGGEIFVVGGPIRDFVSGHDPKDIDFLVRLLTLSQIQQAVSTLGQADEVGHSFGIVKCFIDGQEFDFAIPRSKETKTGDGHADFTVELDPFATVESDLGRRDFTFNAMAVPLSEFIRARETKTPLEGIIDPFNGQADLRLLEIRTVGNPIDRFNEDFLRILRALQFAARFGFLIEAKTLEAIKELAPKLHPKERHITGERIFDEFKKVWVKANGNTGIFIRLLSETGIGKILFGDQFKPIQIKAFASGEELISAQFIAFFIEGGDTSCMKPDNHFINILALARNITGTKDPHTFIGNMKGFLPAVEAFFTQTSSEFEIKTQKMVETAILGKELALRGEELLTLLNVTLPSQGRKVGIAQQAMLKAIWAGDLTNTKESLTLFIENNKESFDAPRSQK